MMEGVHLVVYLERLRISLRCLCEYLPLLVT